MGQINDSRLLRIYASHCGTTILKSVFYSLLSPPLPIKNPVETVVIEVSYLFL